MMYPTSRSAYSSPVVSSKIDLGLRTLAAANSTCQCSRPFPHSYPPAGYNNTDEIISISRRDGKDTYRGY